MLRFARNQALECAVEVRAQHMHERLIIYELITVLRRANLHKNGIATASLVIKHQVTAKLLQLCHSLIQCGTPSRPA